MSATVPLRVRKGLYARSGGRCERCGLRRDAYMHVSHRDPRGMGGKREDWSDMSQWNLLCSNCHLFHVERFPGTATVEGWKVPPGVAPALWPVFTVWGWAYLTPDGAYAWPPLLPRGG